VNHFASSTFWSAYVALPLAVRQLADRDYEIVNSNWILHRCAWSGLDVCLDLAATLGIPQGSNHGRTHCATSSRSGLSMTTRVA
jgi:hypothetical protein